MGFVVEFFVFFSGFATHWYVFDSVCGGLAGLCMK